MIPLEKLNDGYIRTVDIFNEMAVWLIMTSSAAPSCGRAAGEGRAQKLLH